MIDAILALNIGSTSVKASVFAANSDLQRPMWTLRVGAIGEASKIVRDGVHASNPGFSDHSTALEWAVGEVASLPDVKLVGVGHRIVHGGTKYGAPVAIDRNVLEDLRALTALAPGHQPHNLAGVEVTLAVFPNAFQVACFDTGFHRTMPEVERIFALPAPYAEKGIVRYGFHGLSYAHIARVLPEHIGSAADGRVIAGHLGAGVSLCAMQGRKSVATTMGFTALDGPPMATRCGAIDPGVLLYLLQEQGMSPEQVSDLLYRHSGLVGVSGVSSDMSVLLESVDPRCVRAVDLFNYRVSREIGSLAAALGGVDAVVFTGGIGENAARIREAICARSSWLGVELDNDANAGGETLISAEASPVSVLVISADEEQEIARETATLLHAR